VQQLVSRIVEYGILEVSAQTRLDILTKVRDNAGNNYFRAWLENVAAMDIAREWLRAGATGSADNQVLETVMPLLHIADRLPFTGDTLVSSKIGKIVRKLAKDAPIPAVKDMAANLERKWRNQFVFMQDQVIPVDDDVQDAKQKKRKLSDVPSKVGPPAKKSAVSAASSSRPSVIVKKEGKPSTTTTATAAATVKESKSDSSFFSAPKQKPKLPSFKKAPIGMTTPAATKEPPANVAQPSSTDAFQEALKDMRARKPSPSAPSATSNNALASSSVLAGAKPLKKKKSVTWAPDGQLELVKLIERAVYDDDPVDGTPHAVHNVRELDRGEGAALHAHLFEELLDWSEPQPIDIPEDIETRPRGEGSQERSTQEQRELTALGASYLVQPIPESPTDLSPGSILSQEQVDENVVHMLAGAEIDALSWTPAMTTAPLAGASVSELVGQLAEGVDLAIPDALPAPAFDPAVLAQLASSIPQEQLQQLAQMFATQQQQQQPQPQSDQQSWDLQAPAFAADAANASGTPRDRWPPTSEESRWGGSGRGRGRGRPVDGIRQFKSRIPCSFYAQGRQAHIPTPALFE
jgi:protein phosphatase 1 regulatory subunit 10